jgi:hypothetical protein
MLPGADFSGGGAVNIVPDDDEDFFDKQARAEFAGVVIDLFKHSLSGHAPNNDRPNDLGDRWPAIYKVGVGLAVLQKLADTEFDHLVSTKGLLALRESGLREAIALLDALTTGTRHPIFDHVEGLRSKRYRSQREKPNEIDKIDMYGIDPSRRTCQLCWRCRGLKGLARDAEDVGR